MGRIFVTLLALLLLPALAPAQPPPDPLVRVYQPAGDQPVRVLIPNPKQQQAGESEAAFLARIAVRAEEADPTLVGLPSVDLRRSALPKERARKVGELNYDVRAGWRLVKGAVVIDEIKVKLVSPAKGAP